MVPQEEQRCTAFEGTRRIASGKLRDVVSEAKKAFDRRDASVLIFDDKTGEQVDIDYGGSLDEVLERLSWDAASPSAEPPSSGASGRARGPGRPKLGVVSREVTLLPRHWEWLNRQPGGASVALRKLVEKARAVPDDREGVRLSREAAYRFMVAVAGDAPAFEEAARTLFAGNERGFEEHIANWPPDVRDYARKLASPSFGALVGDE